MAGPAGSSNDLLLRSFARSLRARNRSPKTITSYLQSARLLADYVGDRDLLELARGDIEDFIAEQLRRLRPTSAAVRFRSLQRLYRWAVDEELMEASPMTGLKPPSVPEEPVAVLDEVVLSRLLSCMNGRNFDDRRDTAIVRLFLDTGMRLSELAGLGTEDIDLDQDIAVVLGKGRRPRACPSATRPGRRSSGTSGSDESIALQGAPTSGLVAVVCCRTTESTRCSADGLGRQASRIYTPICSATPSPIGGLQGVVRSRTSCGLPAGGVPRCLPGTAPVPLDERARDAHRRLSPVLQPHFS